MLIGVAIVAAAIGYLVHGLRERSQHRKALIMVATDSGGHKKPLSIADAERLSARATATLRDALLGPIGGMRRDINDMAELLGKVEVLLRNAIGMAKGDREQTRQRQEVAEATRIELRAELMGVRKSIDQTGEKLQSAFAKFQDTVEQIFDIRPPDVKK